MHFPNPHGTRSEFENGGNRVEKGSLPPAKRSPDHLSLSTLFTAYPLVSATAKSLLLGAFSYAPEIPTLDKTC
jgi:hypothetical protein